MNEFYLALGYAGLIIIIILLMYGYWVFMGWYRHRKNGNDANH